MPLQTRTFLRMFPLLSIEPLRLSINQPFIVLTETKFSYRYIPVWARYSPHLEVLVLTDLRVHVQRTDGYGPRTAR